MLYLKRSIREQTRTILDMVHQTSACRARFWDAIGKIDRSAQAPARDIARAIGKTGAYRQSRRERKKAEIRFAHLKRLLKLGQLRLRGPRGAHDEFMLAETGQNLGEWQKNCFRRSEIGN